MARKRERGGAVEIHWWCIGGQRLPPLRALGWRRYMLDGLRGRRDGRSRGVWEGAPSDVQLPADVLSPTCASAMPLRALARLGYGRRPPGAPRRRQFSTTAMSALNTAAASSSTVPCLASARAHARRVTSQSQASPRSCVLHVVANHRPPGADARRAIISSHCIPSPLPQSP